MNRFRLDYSSALKEVPETALVPRVQGLWGSSILCLSRVRERIHKAGDRSVSVAFGILCQ